MRLNLEGLKKSLTMKDGTFNRIGVVPRSIPSSLSGWRCF